jgi:adenylate cyclase
MPQERVTRRLAAILAADVVGYSRLIGEDEEGTLTRLKTRRDELIDTQIDQRDGRIVKTMGDGLLVEFPSVVEAVRCAVEVQRGMADCNAGLPAAERIELRIGLNLGDIVIEDDDIFGDGVIVAARLEEIAEPGSVYLSRSVYNQIKGKVDLVFEDLGERQVKNIPEPVRVYRVGLSDSDAAGPDRELDAGSLPLPDKPSIAVLPFQNMSGDPEQEFFADGMAEEIITALSRYHWFFVIARNSSFTYKGRAVDVTQVAKELGVRYVLEGSVRKAGKRVRVTAQLIDATTGSHIWAERYDRELDDIFALQDEITETIVTSIEPQLGAVERERSRRKPPENLGAWDLFQRGLWHLFDDVKRDALAQAKRLFERACRLDPAFAAAYAELAFTNVAEIVRGLTDDPEASLDRAADAAERAVILDPRDPAARVALGRVLIFRQSHERAIAEMEAALALNPSFERGHYGLGMALLYGGRPEESIPQFESGIRLSPRGPLLWAHWMMLGLAYINLGNYEAAAASFEKAIQQPNAAFMVFIHAAATLAHLGRIDEARDLLAEANSRKPGFSMATVKSAADRFGPQSGVARLIDGLGEVGLSE